MSRVGLITAAVVAGLIGVAVAAVGARDAYYWDRPLPGAEVRDADLDRAVNVMVDGKAHDVAPGEVLRLDGTDLVPPPDPAARGPDPAPHRRRSGARDAAAGRGRRRAALGPAGAAPTRAGRRPRRLPDHPRPPR